MSSPTTLAIHITDLNWHMEPFTGSLLVLVLGSLARDLIAEASRDYLKDKLKAVFGWLEKLGEKDKVAQAYQDAMEKAFHACLEMLLTNIKSYGYSDEELKQYASSLSLFIKDKEVAGQLLASVRDPGRDELPAAQVLSSRWSAVGGEALPSDGIWNAVSVAFRRQATRQSLLSDELRELTTARNLHEITDLIRRQGGVRVQVRRETYFGRMRTKFSPVDLANLMPAYAEDPGRVVIRDVFVAQNVRENPPPAEVPKDVLQRLKEEHNGAPEELAYALFDEQQIEKLRGAYVNQAPRALLDVVTSADSRLLVLTGDPGSGKSTLMRYLLTSIIDPPSDTSGTELTWVRPVIGAFPLLIELRDFYALRRSGECDSFLEYVTYMGKTDNWALDDHAVHEYLETGRSLVMFDGLDEIFNTRDRQRVMNEIAGFADRYPLSRIIVTSRPVGYKEQVLRDAAFAHFGIQDLDDEQIETFVRGWFTLTFPQQLPQANQRIDRVLRSVRRSRSIRLLAGNPMLLTIMALLAREEELPRERGKFYEKAVEVLCHHWDANRNLELPEEQYLNADDKKHLLRRIAMRMQLGEGGVKGNIIVESDLEQAIESFLLDERWQSDAAEARKAARRMIQQLRERNYILCLRGPNLYGFVHRTFLEFLTAAEYVRRFDRQPQQMTIEDLIKLFDQHCYDDDWREILRLICGQIDERFVGQIVEHLLTGVDTGDPDAITPNSEVLLAIWCLSEARSKNKVRSSGEKSLDAAIDIYRRGDVEAITALLEPVKEIGVQWPGSHKIQKLARRLVDELPHGGRLYWPQFVSALFPDRPLIREWVDSDKPEVRWDALEVMASKWPDEETRALLEERVAIDKYEHVRNAALQGLWSNWVDERTRTILATRAVEDEDPGPRRTALSGLVIGWPDDKSRRILETSAVQDASEPVRVRSIELLFNRWPDDRTRTFLQTATWHDSSPAVQIETLRILADRWGDHQALAVLLRLARTNAAATVVAASRHSEFGRVVFTEDVDGYRPYLDPVAPLPRAQIRKAAEIAGVVGKVSETTRSLSKYLGWDITKGSGGTAST